MKMIEVKNLTFSYGKDKQALHGLNFSVADGEIFGFLGPNGSGKSTTQKILTGILKGHGGEVSLFGKDLRTAQTQEFFQQIGVLFEFPYLYANLSAVDNLNYFASFYPKEQLRDVKELLEELEFKKDFLNKPVSSYSKGMRQRVSMARALISNPKLLFLDEPTSGLDPACAVLFRKIIEEERQKGTTVFLTTHNMLDADLLCDRVAFITNGNIVALDTPQNLKEKNSNHRIVVSGDELDMFQQTANTLPALYEQREWAEQASVQVLERPDMMAGYQNIFIAITLIVAMFMGCTFNAMNIISEKEDGVALINEILPMTHRQYMMQKIFVGFVFGCLSAILTAAICFRLSFTGAAVMLALIVLSAFVSALIGLFVGKLSDGMMVGVVYIKIVMTVFMAVPILNYLVGAGNKALSYICYLIPSSATFEGIMDLANGTASTAIKDIVILTLHLHSSFWLYQFWHVLGCLLP